MIIDSRQIVQNDASQISCSSVEPEIHALELPAVPFLLRMSGEAIQAISVGVGIVVGVLSSISIYAVAPLGSMVARLFDLGKAQGLLPVIMLIMFCWGFCLCGLRFLRVRLGEKITGADNISKIMEAFATVSLEEIHAQIEVRSERVRDPLMRRIRVVIRQWSTKPSLQDALAILNQHAVSDTEDIHHAYGVAKMFVWALPVLGLIGTVVGIALAVGDFGQLIGGNVDDVSAIKQSLVQVTSGLSFAFTTTLLGLLGALLLVMPATAVQAREEKLVTRTEGIVAEAILPQLQRFYPEVEGRAATPDAEIWGQTLSKVAHLAVQTAASTVDQIMADSRDALAEWNRQRIGEFENTANVITEASGRFGADMRAASDEFLMRLSLIRDTMDDRATILREGLDFALNATEQGAKLLGAALERHDSVAQDLSAKMQTMQSTAQSLVTSQTALVGTMVNLTDGGIPKMLQALLDSMESAGHQASLTNQTLSGMASSSQKFTEYQATLLAGLQQIDTIGLPSALNALGQTLKEVTEVLQSFQEPIVFQAVRASAVVRSVPGNENRTADESRG